MELGGAGAGAGQELLPRPRSRSSRRAGPVRGKRVEAFSRDPARCFLQADDGIDDSSRAAAEWVPVTLGRAEPGRAAVRGDAAHVVTRA